MSASDRADGGATAARRSNAGWLAAGVVALALVCYVLPLAVDIPLVDPDEGLHAAISQEMVERGDWVTPRLLGAPFLDKPVLFFWAEAASLDLVGMTRTGVRLPGLLFGLLGALTTAWLAVALTGSRRAGLLAGVIYATTILPLALDQAAVHDVALVPWTNLAMLCLWRARARRTGGGLVTATAAAGVFVGLAMLTKGLVGVALVGVPFAIWLVAERRLTWRLVLGGALALGVGAAIAAPWYLAMERAQPGYLYYYFVDRHLLGFATTTQVHGDRAWWYYLPIVAGGGLPWVLYLPFTRARRPAASEGTRLAWWWLATDVVLLSLAGSKLVTYVLPAFPALALLAAVVWDGWLEPRADAGRGSTTAVFLHGLALVALLPAAELVARARFGVSAGSAAGIGQAAALAGAILAVMAWRHASRGRAVVWLTGAMAAAFVTIMTALFPGVAGDLSARDLARYLDARGALPPQVWVVNERIGSLIFYLDPALRRGLTPGRFDDVSYNAVLGRLATAPGDVLVALGAREAANLPRAGGLQAIPHDRAGRYRVYTVSALRHGLLERAVDR